MYNVMKQQTCNQHTNNNKNNNDNNILLFSNKITLMGQKTRKTHKITK